MEMFLMMKVTHLHPEIIEFELKTKQKYIIKILIKFTNIFKIIFNL